MPKGLGMVPVAGVEPARCCHRWILSDTEKADFDGTWRTLEVAGEDALPRISQQKCPQNGEKPRLRLLIRAPGPSRKENRKSEVARRPKPKSATEK